MFCGFQICAALSRDSVGGGGEAEGGEGGLNSHTLAARGWGVALAAEVIEFSFRIREDEKILFLKDNLIH